MPSIGGLCCAAAREGGFCRDGADPVRRRHHLQGHQGNRSPSGEWIAISGIGGLGHVAIQYAKAMGLHVVALDVTEEKLALARSLGAELAIDASAPDVIAQVRKQTGGGAHGVLVTAVSPPAFSQLCSSCAAREPSAWSACRRANSPHRYSMWFSSASRCADRSWVRARISPRPWNLPAKESQGAYS